MGKKLKNTLLVGIATTAPLALFIVLSSNTSYDGVQNQAIDQVTGVKAASTERTPSFNKLLYPTDDYKSLWAIISVNAPIPVSYRPDDLVLFATSKGEDIFLRSVAKERAESMVKAAVKEYLTIKVVSGFRSYTQQQRIYATKTAGVAAKPGFSEHQLGLAIDVTTGENENIWLSNHAHKFGFIIRYPENKQNITGYTYKPWHLRYVGVELASEMKTSDKTMEEYFIQ